MYVVRRHGTSHRGGADGAVLDGPARTSDQGTRPVRGRGRRGGHVRCQPRVGASIGAATAVNRLDCPATANQVQLARVGGPGTAADDLDRRRPDATLAKLRDELPVRAGLSTIWREIDRLHVTVKKIVHADEQRRPDVAAERRQWRRWQPLPDMRQYRFLDECGVTTGLLRRLARSLRGTRVHDHAPCGHWETHTVVATLGLHGPRGAPCSMARSTTLPFTRT